MRAAKRPASVDSASTPHLVHPAYTPKLPGTDVDKTLSQYVMELSPDAIVITDAAGRITHVNHQAETLFGFAREELLGRLIEWLLPTRFRHAHVHQRKEYSGTPHSRPMGTPLDLYGRRKDGSEFPAEISLSPLQIGEDSFVISTIRDVTPMRQLERQLQTESEGRLSLLQMVLENMPGGVIVVYGSDARLLLANHHAARLWGGTWQVGQSMEPFLAAMGTVILDADGQPLPPEDWVAMLATRQGKVVSQYQELIRRTNGTSVPVLVSSALLDPALLNLGRILAQNRHATGLPQSESVAVVTYQDISAIKATERLKDEFINLTAHELRTPLTLIQGYAQTLGRLPSVGADDQQGQDEWISWQAEARDAIVHATKRLTRLTDDLLEVSRVQAGEITLHLEPLDLVALVKRARTRLHTAATHSIRVVAESKYVVALVDRRRMEQVLMHLLTNAVKFSPAGGKIVVTLREDRASGLAELSVRDHGIGIPSDQQDQIFGRFVRATNAQQSGISGRGLGLYLCRELIERHGGRLWFHSVEGQGSTFTLVVPLYGD